MAEIIQVLCPDGQHRNFHKGHLGCMTDPTTQERVEHWQGYVFAQNKRVYGTVVLGTSCFTPHGKNAGLVSGEFALPNAVDAESAAILANGDALDEHDPFALAEFYANTYPGASVERDPFALATSVD